MANRKFTSRYNITNFKPIIGQKYMLFSLNYIVCMEGNLLPDALKGNNSCKHNFRIKD